MTVTNHAPASEAEPSAPPMACHEGREVLTPLACGPASGLSAAEADRRRAQGGANTLPDPSCRSALASCLLWSEELRKLIVRPGHRRAE